MTTLALRSGMMAAMYELFISVEIGSAATARCIYMLLYYYYYYIN